jgi:dolichol-phosphate mannosyltransferase
MKEKVELSVVVPMFNEEENACSSLQRIRLAILPVTPSWEIIVVDDGSNDRTKEKVEEFIRNEKRVKLVSYSPNCGRGKALRMGFKKAQGEIICSTDADLSYDENHIVRMFKILNENSNYDLVIGSPYISGGKTENVPKLRLWFSKWGNKILRLAMNKNVTTITGVLRAYRKDCIKSLELESDGKEIHLEILSKALAMGYTPYEMPAVLSKREKGNSKFNLKATATSHIIFSLYEKPMLLFGLIGLGLISAGVLAGIYVLYLWRTAALNPNRPLMTLLVLLVLSGMQVLFFGFIGTQLVRLRKEIYKVQKENKILENGLTLLSEKIDEIKTEKKQEAFLNE